MNDFSDQYVADLTEEYFALRQQAKAMYERSDRLLNKIRGHMQVGDKVEVEGVEYYLVDNCPDNNNNAPMYRPASFRRFELKEVKRSRVEKEEDNS